MYPDSTYELLCVIFYSGHYPCFHLGCYLWGFLCSRFWAISSKHNDKWPCSSLFQHFGICPVCGWLILACNFAWEITLFQILGNGLSYLWFINNNFHWNFTSERTVISRIHPEALLHILLLKGFISADNETNLMLIDMFFLFLTYDSAYRHATFEVIFLIKRI